MVDVNNGRPVQLADADVIGLAVTVDVLEFDKVGENPDTGGDFLAAVVRYPIPPSGFLAFVQIQGSLTMRAEKDVIRFAVACIVSA